MQTPYLEKIARSLHANHLRRAAALAKKVKAQKALREAARLAQNAGAAEAAKSAGTAAEILRNAPASEVGSRALREAASTVDATKNAALREALRSQTTGGSQRASRDSLRSALRYAQTKGAREALVPHGHSVVGGALGGGKRVAPGTQREAARRMRELLQQSQESGKSGIFDWFKAHPKTTIGGAVGIGGATGAAGYGAAGYLAAAGGSEAAPVVAEVPTGVVEEAVAQTTPAIDAGVNNAALIAGGVGGVTAGAGLAALAYAIADKKYKKRAALAAGLAGLGAGALAGYKYGDKIIG